MITIECLGLSFLDRKVTKVVINTASICRLARRSGITEDVSLRLFQYKTKAQAHREHRNYQSRRTGSDGVDDSDDDISDDDDAVNDRDD